MSNNVTVFQNEQFGQVRTIDENGKIYFYGKDAAIALGYADSVNALKRHCRAKGVVFRHLLTEGRGTTDKIHRRGQPLPPYNA